MRLHDGMKALLARLWSESSVDPALREALRTQATGQGVRIGAYEAVRREQPRTHAVLHSATGAVVAEGIALYDVAYAVLRLLDQGLHPQSAAVRGTVALDGAIEGASADLMLFRTRMAQARRARDDARAAICEDRYDAAMDRLDTLKGRLARLVE